jgi:hypothetical protein
MQWDDVFRSTPNSSLCFDFFTFPPFIYSTKLYIFYSLSFTNELKESFKCLISRWVSIARLFILSISSRCLLS